MSMMKKRMFGVALMALAICVFAEEKRLYVNLETLVDGY